MDEQRIIAWLDGELDPIEAEEVARAVAADPALQARAEAHRRLKARLAAAFGPTARQPVTVMPRPEAEVISLAVARQARAAKARRAQAGRRWALPGAAAASLVVGLFGGTQLAQVAGIEDRRDALALAAPIAHALDVQLASEARPVRVALSFRDHDGEVCRSFAGRALSGVACRVPDGWQLRYAAPAAAQAGDYRQAGSDPATAQVIQAMIAGAPFDATQEQAARGTGWK
ncbi:MAG: hypothetical protein JOY99_08195 [Sphingomonadaceae bacterium]|nr:hypothetical protein [Sphingomonadaceae bacterium]